MRLGTLLAAVVIAPALVALGAPAQAAPTYTVTGFDDPSPTPACTGTVCPSLRAAAEAAAQQSGATIQLGSGTFELSQGALSVETSTHLVGSGMGATTIKQTAEHGVLKIGPLLPPALGTTTLQDLTVTGGHSVDENNNSAFAGGIDNIGPLTLTRVAVTGNSAIGSSPASIGGPPGAAGFGSAIVSSDGALTLDSSIVSDNLAQGGDGQDSFSSGEGGAGIGTVVTGSSDLTVVNSTFTNNVVTGGDGGDVQTPGSVGAGGGRAIGGAILGNASVTVRSSTFRGNQVSGGDGGASADGPGGSPGYAEGGAIAAFGPALTVVNSTFMANVATAGQPGSGTTPGPDGIADGGAISADGNPGDEVAVHLASDTFSGNQALSPQPFFGGNLFLDYASPAVIEGSIFEGTDPAGAANNCRIAASTVTGSGHNLENTSPSQCGLSAANHDLIGQSADLGTLADNGGPTQTMLPSASSPVIGAGGACTDPTADPDGPLTVDQRGEPRPAGRPCDIGAVQLPVPLSTAPPTITGPIARHDATCTHGTFVGADPLTYDYAWTRDGQAVGTDQATYGVAVADIGHVLRCTVVAHGPDYDSPPATSAPRTVVPSTPVLSSLTQSRSTWRTPSGHSTSVPIGTTFGFSLTESSTLTLTFTRVVYRRLVGGHCVALTTSNHSRPACSAAYSRAGSTSRSAHAGSTTFVFHGLLSNGHYLSPGHYVVTFTAKNTWGRTSAPAKLRFTIAR
ncbi:choice-of-anchor Q domain-containing protein [Nocardioides marmorisolisilvae]|uniref:Ig-like domain-containing protein n=1 Tax=Nocardioides marmorisolisilvae TaxID=1542737 RepID=A0A3N0DZ93_9ACTN|nr:choice-of-anchor Q domain-containing protein [Nocardioides marmorisolisilvae]RNL80881.1 hypothetical protein EFL95_00375 [Nocardioides marmorisolisilvae]